MNRTPRFALSVALALAAGASALGQAESGLVPIGTAFTYQGQLKVSGRAVNSLTDLQFSLFETEIGGSAIFGPLTRLNVPVNNGVFSVADVDFGVDPYTTDGELWLQVSVRNPAGSGIYVPLTRQRLTAAPFSLATRGINVDAAGNVGIGTETPSQRLEVRCNNSSASDGITIENVGVGSPQIRFLDNGAQGASMTYVKNGSGSGLFDISTGGSSRILITSEGKVGLGVVGLLFPTEALQVGTAGAAADRYVKVASAGGAYRAGIKLQNGLHGFTIESDDNAASNGLNIIDFAASRLFIQNDTGNVGIGTTNPAQRLHVIGNIVATGTITPSCAKLKENVEPMGDALDKLASLDAVRFDWKADEAKTRGFTHDLGFIAEDVAAVFPEVVFRDEKGEIMGLDYARMSAVAVGAIKQLKSENDQIKADNAELRSRLEKIEAMLAAQAAK